MRIGDVLRLAARFPEDAILWTDGKYPYVEVKREGYFDLDTPDKDLPWLNPPEPKNETANL